MRAASRLPVLSRMLAAFFGGYILATVASITVAHILPVAQGEAVISAVLLSFIVWLLAILWCFHAKTALMAWCGLIFPSLVLGAVIWLVR